LRDDNHNQLGEDLSRYLVVQRNDIVFNKLRTWQGGLGVSKYDGIVSPAYFVCRPGNIADSRFLHYLLRSAPYLAELTRISKWMPPSQFDTPWEQLRKLPVLLPPLQEQRRIADFLDAETAHIDQLADVRARQLISLNERTYVATSELLVPGAITRPLGVGLFPWLPSLPDSRPFVRLGYICRLQNGITVDGKRQESGDDVTRPYLRVANVQAGSLSLDSVMEITVSRLTAERSTLRVGDVLMTEGGDLDKLGRGTVWRGEIADCLHQNHVFALRPDPSRLDGNYLALMTQTIHGRCYFESTGVKTTNLASTNSGKILGFQIPLPSVDAQKMLVREVDKELAYCARARGLLERQLDLLAERRQALITAAVTGQIDVSTASGRGVTEGVSA
jgi:type I restriction enzyme S subunit